MAISKFTTEIENLVSQWSGTTVGNGNFGSRTFLFQSKEFGHIHKNGDLDIVFGKKITGELRQRNLVQKHLYTPETAITYPVSNEEKIPFALGLLKFSYLIHWLKANELDSVGRATIKSELAKLPESLRSIEWGMQ
jgi:hypothetical protein